MQLALFSNAPPGFRYREGFISEHEEAALVSVLEGLAYSPYVMRGQASKRRIFSWGEGYVGANAASAIAALPEPIADLATRCAEHTDVARFDAVLATYYPVHATIGWHRDLPRFGPTVVGVSLLAACRMRFRKHGDARACFEQTLAPRSCYVLGGATRSAWEHEIPALREARYSLTFRTTLSQR